jgi:hypothetical protein
MTQRNSHDSISRSPVLPVIVRVLAQRSVLVLVLVLLITGTGAG